MGRRGGLEGLLLPWHVLATDCVPACRCDHPWLPAPAEVANLRDWLLKHVSWMDGAFATAAAAPASLAAAALASPAAGRR